ncbi:MAG: dihydrofolate reductase family protein [Christensenella sp.]|nr:dihydrofolate reductase family protein [Christensenella sp.]
MKEVVLFIAMSLDGYIAAPDGAIDWLGGENADASDFGSYERFIAGVSDIVMGYTTYHQLATELLPGAWPYAAQKTHVLTHRVPESAPECVSFTSEPVETLIDRLKREAGGEIWLCGGASIVHQAMQKGLIDRYHINVIPTIRGGGIRLFGALENAIPLRLISTESYNGIVDLVYAVR